MVELCIEHKSCGANNRGLQRSTSFAAVMVTKRKYGKWLPVHLTENLISEGVDGLVGIEELNDYKVVKGDRDRDMHKVGKGTTMKIYIFIDWSCFPWS